MSSLRNAHVALPILGVRGHIKPVIRYTPVGDSPLPVGGRGKPLLHTRLPTPDSDVPTLATYSTLFL